MSRPIAFVRPAARLSMLVGLVPFTLSFAACNSGSETDGPDIANEGGVSGGAAGNAGAPSGGSGGGAATGGAGSATGGGGAESGGGGMASGGDAAAGGAAGNAGGADAAAVVPDTTAPSIVSTDPGPAAVGVATHTDLTVTFSEAMAPATVSDMSLTVKHGDVAVAGAVTYFNRTATWTPAAPLTLGTTYTATVTTATTDLAGNPLAAAHTWTFTTDATAPLGPPPVLLGAAGNFVILAKTAVSNVPTSVVTGDLAVSPAAATYITGFSLTRAGTRWTSPQVVGSVFAANNDPPTPTNLTTAVNNMMTAYTDAAGRPTPNLNLGGGAIGGLTIVPGLYKWTSAVTIPADITLAGAANDVWIFQVSGNLMLSAAKRMTLSGGARAKNVFWQVAGTVDLGTTSHAEGIILSQTAIKLGTGASINGRLLAQTAVNIESATVTSPSQ